MEWLSGGAGKQEPGREACLPGSLKSPPEVRGHEPHSQDQWWRVGFNLGQGFERQV